MACIDSVQHDEKYWKNPYEFCPEHFIDVNGKFTMQKEGFMPFGIGNIYIYIYNFMYFEIKYNIIKQFVAICHVKIFTGKRQCLGESLAKMELYLFSMAILQRFKISEPENCSINLEPNPGISLMNIPQEQELILSARNNV